MNKYTKFIKSKIGLIMLGLTILFPATVNADTPIQYTTNVSNVLLEHGETYQFVVSNSVNANNTGTTNFGTIAVTTSSGGYYTKHVHTGSCAKHTVQNGTATFCSSCRLPVAWDPTKGQNFCPYCGRYNVSTYSGPTYEEVYDCGNSPANSGWISTYNSKGVVTLTADYFEMNEKQLTVSMGGQSYTWKINVNSPTPRISSNLTI